MSSPSPNTAPPRPIPRRSSVHGRICRRPIVSNCCGGSVIYSNVSWSQVSHQARRTEMNATTALSKCGLPALDELRTEKLHAWHRERLAAVYVRQSTCTGYFGHPYQKYVLWS